MIFGPTLPKKGISRQKQDKLTIDAFYQIQQIWISLGTNFCLKQAGKIRI